MSRKCSICFEKIRTTNNKRNFICNNCRKDIVKKLIKDLGINEIHQIMNLPKDFEFDWSER